MGALVRIYDRENSDYVVVTEIGDRIIRWAKETPVNRRHRAVALHQPTDDAALQKDAEKAPVREDEAHLARAPPVPRGVHKPPLGEEAEARHHRDGGDRHRGEDERESPGVRLGEHGRHFDSLADGHGAGPHRRRRFWVPRVA